MYLFLILMSLGSMSQVEFRGRGYSAGPENDPKRRDLLRATRAGVGWPGKVTVLIVTQHAAYWSYGSKYSKLKKTIEIQIVRLTEVCGKVLIK